MTFRGSKLGNIIIDGGGRKCKCRYGGVKYDGQTYSPRRTYFPSSTTTRNHIDNYERSFEKPLDIPTLRSRSVARICRRLRGGYQVLGSSKLVLCSMKADEFLKRWQEMPASLAERLSWMILVSTLGNVTVQI